MRVTGELKTPAKRERLGWAVGILGGALVVLAAAVVLSANGGRPATPAVQANLLALVPAAFLAGLFSFLSPCTLPILPAYFAFSVQTGRQNVLTATVAFFLGLATTLTILGATATALSLLVFEHLRQITLLGGVAVMVFGVMSLLGVGFTGLQLQERPRATAAGAYLYGATFALGWSACVGPILGAILTLLATQGLAIAQGALLAFVFALGLGAPLIVVSAFFSRLGQGTGFWKVLRGKGFTVPLGRWTLHLHTTSVLSGLLLIVMGYLLASGQLNQLAAQAAGSDLSLWLVDLEDKLRPLFGLK